MKHQTRHVEISHNFFLNESINLPPQEQGSPPPTRREGKRKLCLDEKRELERLNSWRRPNGARINRGPTKNSGFVTDKEIGLKNWHPICRYRGQADLGSTSVKAATLLTELRS